MIFAPPHMRHAERNQPVDVILHTICRKLDNSVAVLILNVPYTLGVFLAAKQSPWFILLSILTIPLMLPYFLSGRRLIRRPGDGLSRFLSAVYSMGLVGWAAAQLVGALTHLDAAWDVAFACWLTVCLLIIVGGIHATHAAQRPYDTDEDES